MKITVDELKSKIELEGLEYTLCDYFRPEYVEGLAPEVVAIWHEFRRLRNLLEKEFLYE